MKVSKGREISNRGEWGGLKTTTDGRLRKKESTGD